jgi:DNA-binding NtrC family response regulator
LHERREDIPILVQRFVKRAAERQHKLVSGFDEVTLAMFSAYSWPGNIRELQNEVERAVALACDEGPLGLQHISSSIRDYCAVAGNAQKVSVIGSSLQSTTSGGLRAVDQIVVSTGDTTLREARALFEARFITDAVARCDGNISRTAKLMGLSRVQLQRKIKEYGLR